MTNEVVDDISYQPSPASGPKSVKAGILPEGATVGFSHPKRASAIEMAPTNLQTSLTARCQKDDCRGCSRKASVWAKKDPELIDLVTDMFVLTSTISRSGPVAFGIDSFKELWASMTETKEELIDGMKAALANGAFTTDHGALDDHNVVVLKFGTMRPALNYGTSGKASQANWD